MFNQNLKPMKKILLIAGIIICTASVVTSLSAHNGNPISFDRLHLKNAAFAWTVTTFDFGKIKVSKPVTHKFTFTNTGDSPLIVTSVQASCGCTVTEYSKDPIPQGAEGFVKATYNAAKVGVFTKTVTVNANTEDGIVQLTIKGEVIE
jgi:hypothetical protein